VFGQSCIKAARDQFSGTFYINSFTYRVKRYFQRTFGLFKVTLQEKWILAIAPRVSVLAIVYSVEFSFGIKLGYNILAAVGVLTSHFKYYAGSLSSIELA